LRRIWVSGKSLAEAWEKSIIELHEKGCKIKTQYDKPEDPASIDSTMMITVEDPLAEPRIHKDFPGGPEDLQEYVMEVVEGVKNHWVRDPNDSNDTRWEYTYNQRLMAYDLPGNPEKMDQIQMMIDKLAESGYTRRAQAITWKVWEDNDCYDPACLQSVWARLIEDEGELYLNMNIRFRSNDAYKAAFMNMFALIQLQQLIADGISKKIGKEVKLGRYCHMADSYHIYGSYLEELDNRFFKGLKDRSFEDRTYNYEDWKDMMEESREVILKKIKDKDAEDSK
jgi:thymidylate synthase